MRNEQILKNFGKIEFSRSKKQNFEQIISIIYSLGFFTDRVDLRRQDPPEVATIQERKMITMKKKIKKNFSFQKKFWVKKQNFQSNLCSILV